MDMTKLVLVTTSNLSYLGGSNLTTSVPGDGSNYPNKYPWWHVILASIAVTCIIVVIVLGNALVIVAIAKDKNLKQLQNWFIASLAVSDLLLGLLIMPFSLANELMGYWYFGNFLCEMWLSIDVLLCTASILNLCLISLDRYWSITRAVSYVKHRTKKKATIMITIVWILSAIICFPPLVGWKRPQPTHSGVHHCVLSQEIGYVVYSTLGSFFIPLLVMVVVYFKIYLAARARARRHLNKYKTGNGQSKQSVTTSVNVTNSMTFRNSIEKLKSSENEAMKSGNDMTSLSPSDSCQEGATTDGNSAADKVIEMREVNSKKCTKVGQSTGTDLAEERRNLLCDETDVTESGSEMTRRSDTGRDKDGAKSETDDVILLPSQLRGNMIALKEMSPSWQEGGYANTNTIHSSPPMANINQANELTNENVNTSGNCTNNCVRTEVKNTKPEVNDSVIERSVPSLKVIKTYSTESANSLNRANPNNHEISLKTSRKNFLSPNRPVYINNKTDKPKKRSKELRKAVNEPERLKRKIARARERRATLVLGIIMATFILCWLPFFGTYLISTLAELLVPDAVFAIMFWAGYCNSALNPIIYTIFNQDFRKAFQRILCRKRVR